MYKIPVGKNSALFARDEVHARAILAAEGKKLERIAHKVWEDYLGSYYPAVYRRTGKTKAGIKLLTVERDGVIGFRIILTFEDEKMYHKSYIDSGQPDGHSMMLISSGWEAKKLEKHIGVRDRFTRYQGFNYLGKVMAEYNKVRSPYVSFDISWTGKDDYTK